MKLLGKKKAVILFGSPRNDGNTKKVLNKVEEVLTEKYEFYTFNCYKQNVKPCFDCKFCCKNNVCINRDLDILFEKIEKSDLLILASPVYNMGFPAPLKAVLDRLQVFYNLMLKQPLRKLNVIKKDSIIILTQGSENAEYSEILFKHLKMILKPLNFKISHKLLLKGTDSKKLNLNDIENHLSCIKKELT